MYIENTALWDFFYWKLDNTLLDDSVNGNKIMNLLQKWKMRQVESKGATTRNRK